MQWITVRLLHQQSEVLQVHLPLSSRRDYHQLLHPDPQYKTIREFRLQLARELIGDYCSRRQPGCGGGALATLQLQHFPSSCESGPRKTKGGCCTHSLRNHKRTDSQWFYQECGMWLCHNGDTTSDCFYPTYGTTIGNISYDLSVQVILCIKITTIAAAGGDTCNSPNMSITWRAHTILVQTLSVTGGLLRKFVHVYVTSIFSKGCTKVYRHALFIYYTHA